MCSDGIVCGHQHKDKSPVIPKIAESPPDTASLPLAKKLKTIKDRIKPRSDALVSIIMLSWHTSKNGDLDPRFVSEDALVWWICLCKTNCLDTCTYEHEWQAKINSRFTKDGDVIYGCPWCSARGKVCPCQSLETRRPILASQWHPTLNGSLLPSQVSVHSGKKVYWVCLCKNRNTSNSKCTEGCEEIHIYKASVNHRANGRGCSLCRNGGKLFCPCQSIEARFPEVIKEWDYALNARLPKRLPREYAYASHTKVSWICPECKHQYPTQINNRTGTNPTGCPKCNENKWEKKLLDILIGLQSVLDHGKPSLSCYDEVLQKNRVLIPDAVGVILANNHNFCIEFDGPHHFQSQDYGGGRLTNLRLQICSDIAKNNFAANNNMSLLRIAYSDCKTVKNMEKRVREFLEYCANTTVTTAFFSNPDLYQKTYNQVNKVN